MGYCNKPYIPSNDCPDHYYPVRKSDQHFEKFLTSFFLQISGQCFRISPYPKSFEDARDRCIEEGSKLAYILNSDYVEQLEELMDFLMDKVSVYLSIEKLWLGGMPLSAEEWFWMAHYQPFETFDNWDSDPECSFAECNVDMRIAALPFDGYKWTKENKSSELPYACVFNCKKGFTWSFKLQRCLKIVTESKDFLSATVDCNTEEGGQLVSLSSCREMDLLQQQLDFEGYSYRNFHVGVMSNIWSYPKATPADLIQNS